MYHKVSHHNRGHDKSNWTPSDLNISTCHNSPPYPTICVKLAVFLNHFWKAACLADLQLILEYTYIQVRINVHAYILMYVCVCIYMCMCRAWFQLKKMNGLLRGIFVQEFKPYGEIKIENWRYHKDSNITHVRDKYCMLVFKSWCTQIGLCGHCMHTDTHVLF